MESPSTEKDEAAEPASPAWQVGLDRPLTPRESAAAGKPPPVSLMGWVRLWTRVAAMLVLLIFCVPLHYLFHVLHILSPWPRLFLRAAARICGARMKVTGTPLKRDVFFISNHLSWIDILVLAGASGTAFVAKAEIGSAPVVGWLAKLNRTVFVKREHRMGVAEQLNQLRDALIENWSITVFPEGTTTDGRSLLPFKTPMLKVLEPPPLGVMVQPVVLEYDRVGEDLAWVGVETGKDNAVRVLSRKGTFGVKAHYLEPFDPHEFPGRKAIAAESRRQISEALEKALGEPLRPHLWH